MQSGDPNHRDPKHHHIYHAHECMDPGPSKKKQQKTVEFLCQSDIFDFKKDHLKDPRGSSKHRGGECFPGAKGGRVREKDTTDIYLSIYLSIWK